jgi:hypothetical protein
MTLGLARATSHRVLSPPKGSTPRYSIPFFQNTRQEAQRGGIQLDCESFRIQFQFAVSEGLAFSVPPDILQLKQLRGIGGETDCENCISMAITYH